MSAEDSHVVIKVRELTNGDKVAIVLCIVIGMTRDNGYKLPHMRKEAIRQRGDKVEVSCSAVTFDLGLKNRLGLLEKIRHETSTRIEVLSN